MRRAIVHIGMPRTGSTSFQEVLAGLRPRLGEAGLLYPELAGPGVPPAANVNHQPLGEALDGRRPRGEGRAALDRLDAALAGTGADTVILSYEDFSVQRAAFGVPEILRAAFARRGFRMEVLMMVKPPFAFLNSAYAHRAQLVREGGSFGDYVRRGQRHRGEAQSRGEEGERALHPCGAGVARLPLRQEGTRRQMQPGRLLDEADIDGRAREGGGGEKGEFTGDHRAAPLR